MNTSRPSFTRTLLTLAMLSPLALNAAEQQLAPGTIWQYGDNASGESLAASPSGGLYVAGEFLGSFDNQDSHGGSDVFVTAFSVRGERLWSRVLGSDDHDYIGASTVDGNGNIYITGTTPGAMTEAEPAGSFDVFISRLDADGSIVWTRQFGSSEYDNSQAITSDAEGNIYVTGRTAGALTEAGSLGGHDMYLASFTPTGEQRWLRQFGTAESDIATALTRIGDTIYLAGNSRGKLDGSPSNRKPDIVLRAFSTDGEVLWSTQFGTARPDYAVALAPADNGDLFLTSYSYGDLETLPNQGDADIFVSRISSNGERLWTRSLGSDASDIPKAMTIGKNGNLFVTGYTHGTLGDSERHGNYDAFTAAWTPDGEFLGVQQYGGRGFNQPNSIAATTSGAVFVLGNASTDLDDDPATGDGRIYLGRFGEAVSNGAVDNWPPNVILRRGDNGFEGFAGDSEDLDLSGTLSPREDLNGNGAIDFRSEDSNSNGQLEPGEDIDGDGLLNQDTGLASITLDSTSDNLVLDVTPFTPGAMAARFSIRRSDDNLPSRGRLIIRDLAGNAVSRDIDLSERFCATTIDQINIENAGNVHIPQWAMSPRDNDDEQPNDTLWITRTDNTALFDVLPHVSYPSWSLEYTLKPNASGSATVHYEVVDYATGGKEYYCGEESFHITVLPEIAKPAPPAPEQPRLIAISGEPTEIDLTAEADLSGLISAVSQPLHGTVSLNGNIGTYASTAGYTGPDAFSYWVKDDSGKETAHRILLNVVPAADSGSRVVVSVKGDSGARRFTAQGGGVWHWVMPLLLLGIRLFRRS